jgi:hypothetical protein
VGWEEGPSSKEGETVKVGTTMDPPAAAAATRRRRPPHMMLVFSQFSPKKVPFEYTTEAVVALVFGRWDGGRGRPRRRGRPPRSAPDKAEESYAESEMAVP